jgi:hypothetical protein
MFTTLMSLLMSLTGTRKGQPPARRHAPRRPRLEPLEERCNPSSFTAFNVTDLIGDINAANAAGGANTITLALSTTFKLTAGELYIAPNDNLSVTGNGDTIQRSTAKGTPAFRIFEVANGASLTLANLTLQGGLADQGGGIWSDGTLTMTGCTVRNNQAIGAGTSRYSRGRAGDASGGGIYVAGGTVSLTSVTLSGNTAQGGNGGNDAVTITRLGGRNFGPGDGGNGWGGAMYVASGSVSLRLCTVTGNSALAGSGGNYKGRQGSDGVGYGGGLLIVDGNGASVGIDASTLAQFSNNKASTGDPDIDGSYTTIT